MKFLHLGREVGIGANSYAVDFGEDRVVLDAGLHPKREGWQAAPAFSRLGDGPEPKAIFLTHAHQDHVGSLPVLTKLFPRTPVFCTEETHRVADVMLHNSVNVMNRQREEKGIADAALFTHRGVELSRQNWLPRPTGQRYTLDGERAPESTAEPVWEIFPAGHILGSAGVLFRCDGRSVFYTGDVHFQTQTLMRPADFPQSGVDVLIMETTRGDSPSDPEYTRDKEKARLAGIINAATEDDVAVTIPVFALGKTQELLAMLWEMKLAHEIPNLPVYIGGLSTKVTEIYDAFAVTAYRSHPELQLLHELAPYVVSGRDIDSLRPRKRCIFALSSGMLSENTLSNIFVRRILENPKQHLAFVGYSDPESPAGRLRAAAPGSSVELHEGLPPLRRECTVHELNFSAHSPREDLLDYAVRLRPSTIILVHGDPAAMEWFRSQLATKLPATRVVIAQPGVPVDL
jgi:Cft2 family RNA processing exonuclease